MVTPKTDTIIPFDLKDLLKSMIENAHATCLLSVGAAERTGMSVPGYSVNEINRMYRRLHDRLDEAIPDDEAEDD